MGRPPLPIGTYGRIWCGRRGRRWLARANFRDYDGHTRPVERYGPTPAAAQRALREALRDRTGPDGDQQLTGQSRLRDAAAIWQAELQDADLAAGTMETYRRSLRRHVLPGLGELQLRETTTAAIDRWLRTVRAHHGPGARRTAKGVAAGVLGVAVRHGAIASNPVRDVAKAGGTRRRRPRALTEGEATDVLKRVAAEAGGGPAARMGDELDLNAIVTDLLGTGCRIGEALAMRRDVIDLEAGTLEVNATVVRVSGYGSVLQERAKTDAGWRVIAAHPQLVERWRARLQMGAPALSRPVWVIGSDGTWRQVPCHELGLLYPGISGGVRNPSNVERGLRAVLDRTGDGYGWVVPHTFRRTMATRLDEAGLSARAIADHLGHERPSMTQDVYMGRGVACAAAAEVPLPLA